VYTKILSSYRSLNLVYTIIKVSEIMLAGIISDLHSHGLLPGEQLEFRAYSGTTERQDRPFARFNRSTEEQLLTLG